tara:strand:- start:124 stop:270 length:147 start_codon:yes stop_codon:yes gene_type:complete
MFHLTNPNIPRLEVKIIQYCNENNITEYPKKKMVSLILGENKLKKYWN